MPTGFSVLNASEWQGWPRGLERGLHSAFVEAPQNYCPALLLLRGIREPLVFRFFYAFRDAKHGNREALDRLERRMFDEFLKLDRSDAG